MKGALNSPEMEEITPEYVTRLGKEWLDFLVDTTPDEELFSLPKLEHRLELSHRDGERDGEAKIPTRQLQRRFGTGRCFLRQGVTPFFENSLHCSGHQSIHKT
ncbi:MAG: hypothetical protein HQL83_03360 [Magnetococcales bacterium]|nr:hypothetical protein [Magnetococcales bacterium]